MINLFEKLQSITKSLNNPNLNYWEKSNISWNREAKAPNGETFNEQQMYESIRESDVKRLLKFQ